MSSEPRELTLAQVGAILRRRLPLVLFCGALVAVSAFAFSHGDTKRYRAGAELHFRHSPLSARQWQALGGTAPIPRRLDAAAEIATVPAVFRRLATAVGSEPAEVEGAVDVSAGSEVDDVRVSAVALSPGEAAELANGYVKALVVYQNGLNRHELKQTRSRLEVGLDRAQGDPQLSSLLGERLEGVEALARRGYGDARVTDLAAPPAAAESPKTWQNAGTGLLVGLLLGAALVLLLELPWLNPKAAAV
jgi:capsular polysaccharide biosynthesis protein